MDCEGTSGRVELEVLNEVPFAAVSLATRDSASTGPNVRPDGRCAVLGAATWLVFGAVGTDCWAAMEFAIARLAMYKE